MQNSPWLTPFLITFRNLRRRLWRSFLTALGVALGVAVLLAIDVTNQSTLDSLVGVFDRSVGKAELMVIPRDDEELMDAGVIQEVERTPGVLQAAPAVAFQTVLAEDGQAPTLQGSAEGAESGEPLEIRGTDLELDQEFREYPLVSGRFPENDRYEALTTQEFAADAGLEIGQDLSLLIPSGTADLEIVGLLGEEGAGLANDGAVAYTPLPVAQELFAVGDRVHEISIQVEPGLGSDPGALENLKNRLDAGLGASARTVYPAARGELVPRMLDSYQTGLFFFSIVALFVGSFLIYNAFSMTVTERTQEIGMLRAIGMSQGQILRLVLIEAGTLALVGSLLGVVAGRFLARGLTFLLSGFLAVDESLAVLSAATLAKSIGFGWIMTYLAALIPSIQAARTSPLEALRARSRSIRPIPTLVWLSGLMFLLAGWGALYLIKWSAAAMFPASTAGFILFMLGAVLTIPLLLGPLERSTRPLVELIYQKEGALGSSNVRRSTVRTALTVACLMVAMVMIIAIGSLSQIFKEDIGDWVSSALGSDLYVRTDQTMPASFSNRLAGVPGVRAVSPSRHLEVRTAQADSTSDGERQDTLLLAAIDPAAFRQVGEMVFVTGQGDAEENWARLSQGGALFISSVVAEDYGLVQGDTLTLQTRRGNQPFEVAAITSDFTGEGMVVTGTYADLERWFSESGADRLSIALEPNYTTEMVSQEIQERYGDRYDLDVKSTATVKSNVMGLLDRAFLLFDVLSMIGIVIGGMGVFNTLMMNVTERTREIGGMRSLGMTRGQMIRMVLAESLAMGLVGCIYGVIFGYAMSKVFVAASMTITGYELIYAFTPRPFILAILIALGVSQIAAFTPARRAASLNLIEALKHE